MSNAAPRDPKSIRRSRPLRASRARRSAAWTGLEALEFRTLLDGSPFTTGVITPLGGTPTVIAGPGGLDGTPQLDLNNDGFGDYIVRYGTGGGIGGPAAIEVSAILSDGVSPDTGVRRWKEYRIGHYINSDAVVSVTLGDLTSDGQTDLVIQATDTTSASSARRIDLYLGHDNGTFTTGQTITLGSLPRGANLSIFDANGDGKNDLFQQTDGKITIYKGVGDGTVTVPGVVSQIPIGSTNGLDFSKDLTGDGIRDIAVSGVSNDGFASAFIGVYKGSASGSYTSTNLPIPPGFGTGALLQFLTLENLDANPALDVIAIGSSLPLVLGAPATVFVFRNNGTGTFTQSFSSGAFANGLFTPLNSDASPLLPLVVGDIDNDGDTDLAVMEGNITNNGVTIHIERNNGNAGFSESQSIPVAAFPNTSRILLVDMDNDGFDDLVVHHDKTTGGKVTTVYFSNGNGTFAAGLDVDHGLNSITNARIADFNNDGKQDLQFHTYADGLSGYSLTVMLNQGKTFGTPVTTNLGNVAVPQEGGGIPSNFPIFPLRDYDGDGVPDIIGNSSGSGTGEGRPLGLTVIKGATDGSFTFLEPSLIYNVNGNATGAAIVADFNLDGKPDLLLGTNSTGSIGATAVINGDPLPPDTAGTNQNSPRLLGALTGRITVIEHVSADANADPRDRFDWYRFSIDTAVTVRSTAIPLVAPVVMRTARLDGIGTGNDFPNGLEPVFIDKALTAGSWHSFVDRSSNSETDYRLDIFVPAAGPDIGVYQGLEQRVSGQGTLDYGTLKKNTTDTRRTFLVRNDGLATLDLTAIQFPAGYSIADNSLVATLAPGAHDYVTIQLDTSAVGTFNGNIVIPSNDPDTPSFIIPVSATVEDQGPIPQPLIAVLQGQTTLASGQTAVGFGTATQGTPQPLQKIFTIRNDGNANLTLGTPQMPNGFVLSIPPSSLTLTPSQSVTFTVSVGTADVGTFSGNITFTHNSGGTQATFTIPVSATVSQSNGGGGLPDLTGEIQQVSLGKNPVTPQDKLLPGDTLNATLRVFNAGIGVLDKGEIDITFFASTDFTIDGGDVELQTFTAKNPVIVGGGHVDLNFNVSLPQNTPPGNYRLLARLDATGQITESGEANNTAPSGTILPVVLEVGQVGSRSNVMLTLQEPDGTLVTFGLSGGGTAGIAIDPETGAIDLNILEVGEKSTLTINSKPATKAGDNTVLLRNVTIAVSASTQPVNASALSEGDASTEPRTAAQTSSINPLGKLLAKTARLIGTLTAPGGLGALTLDAAEGAVIDIGAPTDPKATLTLTLNLLKDVTFTSQTPVKALSVVQWLDTDETPDSFTAPSLGSLATKGNKAFQIAGDFEADLNLTGVPGQAVTLGSAKIAGALAGAAWTLAGNAGAITVTGNTNNSSITAGTIKALTLNGGVNTLAVNLTQPFNPANAKLVNLPKFVAKGISDQLTLTSAGSVGAVTLGGLTNSTISVGLADEASTLPADGSAFLSAPGAPGASLGKVTITGTFSVNNIAAASIASLTLPEPVPTNGGTPFGVASRAIKAGKIGTLKLVDADKSGSIDPLTNVDFELRIL